VELAIDDAVPYLAGETDSVSLSVDLNDRTDVALLVISELISSIDLHAALFDEAVPEGVKTNFGSEIDLVLGVTLASDEVAGSLARVITPELLDSLQAQAITTMGPYLIGQTDTFTFTIPLAEQVGAIQSAFNRILQEVDLQPYLLDEIIDPALDEFIINGVDLPLGVTIARAEIRLAMEALRSRQSG